MSVPHGRMATLGGLAGGAGIVAAAVGIAGIHLGLWSPLSGFYVLLVAIGPLGLTALLGGLWGLVVAKRAAGGPGLLRAALATALGVALLGLLVFGAVSGSGLPSINDVATDLNDPPQFEHASSLVPNSGRDMAFPADFVAPIRAHYPDLQTVLLDVAPAAALERARATALALGWEVTQIDATRYRLEATDTSTWLRFVDDIVVRIAGNGKHAVVDIRSKSRDGRGDFGVNAQRIRLFTAALTGSS